VTDDALVGTWLKESTDPCSSSYPDELELHAGGRALGHMLPGAREHPRWDVGTFERLDDGRLGITQSNDALGRYAFSLTGDRLTLTDETGCTFTYRRK
jgi:hypothetical protein